MWPQQSAAAYPAVARRCTWGSVPVAHSSPSLRPAPQAAPPARTRNAIRGVPPAVLGPYLRAAPACT
jgi:hypothetical protein